LDVEETNLPGVLLSFEGSLESIGGTTMSPSSLKEDDRELAHASPQEDCICINGIYEDRIYSVMLVAAHENAINTVLIPGELLK
jgi:hypothetical protein